MSFSERSEALVELLEAVDDAGLGYVLVGGYAVSAFETRFSTDLDVVVANETVDDYDSFLTDRGFEQQETHEKNWAYATEVVEYERRLGPKQPIGVDLLVNGLGCRQTGAQWSYDYLTAHSAEERVRAGTVTTTADVVDGTVLVAAKLHSGRATDIRDVLAVAEQIDLSAVTRHIERGESGGLRDSLQRGLDVLDTDELRHGFRSDFGASTVSTETVERLRAYLEEQIAATE